MSSFQRTRPEVEALFERWLEANRRAEAERSWSALAEYYAEDAVYRYTMGAFGERVARGREAIRKLVMERDMRGFEGWTFPYEWVVIDGDRVMTKWYNQAPHRRQDGTPYRVVGMSAIRLDHDLKIVEMTDCFDLAALLAMIDEMRAQGLAVERPG
ncbi:MAG: nuclear transport factor 2 family protein [Myxococcota bacterium]